MNINETILDAIQKNLPSVTAGELKKFIEEAEKTEQQHENLSGAYEAAKLKIANFDTNRHSK